MHALRRHHEPAARVERQALDDVSQLGEVEDAARLAGRVVMNVNAVMVAVIAVFRADRQSLAVVAEREPFDDASILAVTPQRPALAGGEIPDPHLVAEIRAVA